MRLKDLERELRAERPAPETDFARRLDEWAAAGFPREEGLGPRVHSKRGPVRSWWERVSALPPRRMLLPAGAVATVVVVAGAAITQIDGGDTATLTTAPAPNATQKPAVSAGDAATAAESAPAVASDSGAGGVARGTDERITDSTAQLTLGAAADEVQDVVNDVIAVSDRYDGIVQSNDVTTDEAGARGVLELEIPTKRLGAALADISRLGDVISRSESTDDITARFVRARKDLSDVLDQIAKARVELIRADTREERLVIKARIASLQANADALQAQVNGVKREGRFATVVVEVTSQDDAGAAGNDDDWSLGDAVDDAGHVLEVIGGIALATLAVLVPLALVAALAWLAAVAARRRLRERALDA
jgi:hypothetical protein